MPRVKGPACFGFVLLSLFLSASVPSRQALHAQSQNPPVAGTTVVVRMTDAVDSGSDPAGKNYRSSVTAPVNAGNGVTIAQGAAATVTLASNGSGWVAQLSSVVINGQAVAVTSSSASVTSTTQSAVGSVANTATSVLRGLGRPRNVPPSVAAVATGARVVLPPGTTLSFILSAAPLANAAPAAASSTPVPPPPVASAPAATNTSPSPVTASGNSAAGHLTAMNICFSNPPPNPSDLNFRTQYLTAVFEVDVDTLRAIPVLEPAFSAYLKATNRDPSAGITCQPIWSIADAQAAQKKIADGRDSGRLKVIDTGWRYGQPPLAQGQSGFDPLAQGQGGLDLSQQRLTTYFCTLLAAGGTSWVAKPGPADATRYVSPIFQADWDSAAISKAWVAYIRDHYVHDIDLTSAGNVGCSAQSPAVQTMMHPAELRVDTVGRHIVPVDWTYTPAQAAEAQAAESAGAAKTAAAATAASPTASYVVCASDRAGPVVYFSDIFTADLPVQTGKTGNGGPAEVMMGKIRNSYSVFLTQKYSFKDNSNYPVECGGNNGFKGAASLRAAQTYKQSLQDLANQQKHQIVETGWKNE
jgi:hypothetical protein